MRTGGTLQGAADRAEIDVRRPVEEDSALHGERHPSGRTRRGNARAGGPGGGGTLGNRAPECSRGDKGSVRKGGRGGTARRRQGWDANGRRRHDGQPIRHQPAARRAASADRTAQRRPQSCGSPQRRAHRGFAWGRTGSGRWRAALSPLARVGVQTRVLGGRGQPRSASPRHPSRVHAADCPTRQETVGAGHGRRDSRCLAKGYRWEVAAEAWSVWQGVVSGEATGGDDLSLRRAGPRGRTHRRRRPKGGAGTLRGHHLHRDATSEGARRADAAGPR